MIINLKNRKITDLVIPKVTTIGDLFLHSNKTLVNFSAPELRLTGKRFLFDNNVLTAFSAPILEAVGPCFLLSNNTLKNLGPNKIKYIHSRFLNYDTHVDTPLYVN